MLAGSRADVTPCQQERSLQPCRGMRYLASESCSQPSSYRRHLTLADLSRCCLSSWVHSPRPFLFDS